MSRRNPKHTEPNLKSNQMRQFHRTIPQSRLNVDQFLGEVSTPLKEMDDKLYNDLVKGISNVVHDLSKEMDNFDGNEKNSEDYKLIEKIKQDLIRCVHPNTTLREKDDESNKSQ